MSESETDPLPPSPTPGRLCTNNVRMAAVFISAVVLVLFIIRMTGYPLLGRHDARVSSYVLDAVQNGNWIVQKEYGGEIAAKPPLLTWCAAVPTLLTGRISRVAIHLPAAAALCAAALVLLVAGRNRYGWRAGFLAAFAYVVSPAGYSQLSTARYDGLLALMVILSALAAFRAWSPDGEALEVRERITDTNGRGWTDVSEWYWNAIGGKTEGPWWAVTVLE